MTEEQEIMRDTLRSAYHSNRTVRVEFLDGQVREGRLIEFRDNFSLHAPPAGSTTQVRFEGDRDLANVVMMKSVT